MGWYDVRDGNPLKRALSDGGTLVGSFIRMPTPEIAEICAHAGCDFVIVDAEHTPVGWERIAAIIVAAENAGTTPILRVSNPSRDLVSRGLDAGAHGIMIPQVEDHATAASVIAATRYGPDGTRGTAGNMRTGYGMKIAYPEYVSAANDSVFVVLQIESSKGVEAVTDIASVERIDCIFIGLTDLSVNLGHPGDYQHAMVEEQVDRILQVSADLGVPVGVPVSDHEMAETYIRRGARFIATGDVGMFGRAVRGFVEGVHRSTG